MTQTPVHKAGKVWTIVVATLAATAAIVTQLETIRNFIGSFSPTSDERAHRDASRFVQRAIKSRQSLAEYELLSERNKPWSSGERCYPNIRTMKVKRVQKTILLTDEGCLWIVSDGRLVFARNDWIDVRVFMPESEVLPNIIEVYERVGSGSGYNLEAVNVLTVIEGSIEHGISMFYREVESTSDGYIEANLINVYKASDSSLEMIRHGKMSIFEYTRNDCQEGGLCQEAKPSRTVSLEQQRFEWTKPNGFVQLDGPIVTSDHRAVQDTGLFDLYSKQMDQITKDSSQ